MKCVAQESLSYTLYFNKLRMTGGITPDYIKIENNES